MNNILKSLGALVISCFVMLDVNAMQHQDGLRYEIGSKGYYKVTKYPNFSGVVKLIDIEVSYNGEKNELKGIYMYIGAKTTDKGLSMWNIIKSLDKFYKKMSHETKVEIADKCYTDILTDYHRNF